MTPAERIAQYREDQAAMAAEAGPDLSPAERIAQYRAGQTVGSEDRLSPAERVAQYREQQAQQAPKQNDVSRDNGPDLER